MAATHRVVAQGGTTVGIMQFASRADNDVEDDVDQAQVQGEGHWVKGEIQYNAVHLT